MRRVTSTHWHHHHPHLHCRHPHHRPGHLSGEGPSQHPAMHAHVRQRGVRSMQGGSTRQSWGAESSTQGATLASWDLVLATAGWVGPSKPLGAQAIGKSCQWAGVHPCKLLLMTAEVCHTQGQSKDQVHLHVGHHTHLHPDLCWTVPSNGRHHECLKCWSFPPTHLGHLQNVWHSQ
jgi:hypothetical protein